MHHCSVQDYRPNQCVSDNHCPTDERLKVIFLKETKATTCYGCKGKFRNAGYVALVIVPPCHIFCVNAKGSTGILSASFYDNKDC